MEAINKLSQVAQEKKSKRTTPKKQAAKPVKQKKKAKRGMGTVALT